ncbi:hypothetical protein [Clostridium felsineum]|uniref:Uncharacterized protein n=1 Tax=Clostridium felsineum TaxID=36839 RepID=A0A1S8L4K1_9CLOT|nr:hypothetical protein [Clostridium felsineum]URZ06788.1 hypothetical protein CLROS_021210 [Clostridium felsineum]URZ11820.1 hypothetical protein CROST_025370 [Clostridium felsineum]
MFDILKKIFKKNKKKEFNYKFGIIRDEEDNRDYRWKNREDYK